MSGAVRERLGVYMRTAAAQLQPDTALSLSVLAKACVANEKYTQDTMDRLVRIGIAKPVEGGWVQGLRWAYYAQHHGWRNTKDRFGFELG